MARGAVEAEVFAVAIAERERREEAARREREAAEAAAKAAEAAAAKAAADAAKAAAAKAAKARSSDKMRQGVRNVIRGLRSTVDRPAPEPTHLATSLCQLHQVQSRQKTHRPKLPR